MSEVWEKQPQNPGKIMSPDAAVEHVAGMVRQAAEPAQVGERVCAAITRAARRLGLPDRKVKKLWYGERRTPLHEYLYIQSRLNELEAASKRRKEGQHELATAIGEASRAARGQVGPLVRLAQETQPEVARLAQMDEAVK